MVDTLDISEASAGVTFAVKVIPRAAQNRIAGVEGTELRVRLKAAPVEGKANGALIEFLAELFNVKKANVQILRGETSHHKLVRVRGVTAVQVKALLATG